MSLLVERFLAALPASWIHALAWTLSWLWWGVLRTRRGVATENLRYALPHRAPGPLLRKMMAELVLSLWETLRHRHRPLVGLEYEGFERLEERAERGEGCLVLAGHSGAWELLAMGAAVDRGLPVTLMGRPPAWGPARRMLERVREEAGLEVLPPHGAIWRVLAALEEGRVVVFLLDQRHNQGQPVQFFGRPAWTSRALAVVARRSGCPVYGAWTWRTGPGRHRFVVEPSMDLSGEADTDNGRFMAFYERRIQERPEAWLWLHDRWRDPRELV